MKYSYLIEKRDIFLDDKMFREYLIKRFDNNYQLTVMGSYHTIHDAKKAIKELQLKNILNND